ncbi:hypothetical protein D3C81_2072000 [compost metagenome]
MLVGRNHLSLQWSDQLVIQLVNPVLSQKKIAVNGLYGQPDYAIIIQFQLTYYELE